MTLGRLIVAWLLVAIWFVLATLGTGYLIVKVTGKEPPPADPVYRTERLRVVRWRAIEAALLTLVGSLWFDSLGSGEWWIVFLLLGGLAGGPRWARHDLPTRVAMVGTGSDLLRYLIAGALLAWRLS